MKATADSTAYTTSPAEREADSDRSANSAYIPVFVAFDELGLTGRDVAELAGVTPPTVSKWRSSKVRIPGDKLAFLTLVLAHILDEASSGVHTKLDLTDMLGDKDAPFYAVLDSARAHLTYQDVLNRDLAPIEVREGAQKFRIWWASGAAEKLQNKRFEPRSNADILKALKTMGAKG